VQILAPVWVRRHGKIYFSAHLDPSLNVSGGFWRIFYTGTGPASVQDWSMLVEPGDIVRLEWFKPELSIEHISGHSTTVLAAVNAEGMIEVYDNIDYVDHVSTIGVHTTSYWQETNPSGITIYRLDPNQQYLIEGTSLSEVIQGSVFDDLIEPSGGADIINAGPGNNEIQDITAHLNGITVTDFNRGDTFDFTDLDPDHTVVT
jgi:hypothetical protein